MRSNAELDAGGYTLTGPLIRRGDVYLADVVVGRSGFERLVIDAGSGRIVERFRARPARWRDAAPRDWNQDQSDSWDSPPRPPAGLAGPPPRATLDLPGARSEPAASSRDLFVRGEDAAKPTVILGPGGARATSSDLTEKPKPKPKPRDAKRKTAAPASVAKATNPPAPEKAAEPAAAPLAVTPPAVNAASPPPPSRAAKADAPASVVAAKSPPPAETPDAHAPTKSKAVNDLPVTPLD